MLGEAGARGEQGVELAGGLEQIEATEGGQDPLFGLAVVPVVLDELEVAAGSGGFDTEEHGTLVKKDSMIIRAVIGNSTEKLHLFRLNVAP